MNDTRWLNDLIVEYYQVRGLEWPDADEALEFCLTELVEAKELRLSRKKKWVRNNPEGKEEYSEDKFVEELGDIVMMALVAGYVLGRDPIGALCAKIRRKAGI